MSSYEKLEELLKEKNGTLKLKDIRDYGVHSAYVQKYIEMGKLERVSRGIYCAPNIMEDIMYILGLKKSAIIYSHETALYLHDLTDRDPINYSVTVPTGYNTKNLLADNLTVYSIKKELYTLGETKKTTIYGNEVRCYNLERTICDVVRSRNKMDVAVVMDAIKRYSKLKNKNLNMLMDYAKKFKVTHFIKEYLGVLL